MLSNLIYIHRKRVGTPIVAVALAFVASVAVGQDSPQPASLILTDLTGAQRSLADERGHITVVNFWATWCLPCIEELPLLEEIAQAYADRGVRFVAASTDDASTSDRIPEAIGEAGVTFPVWTGATTIDMQRFDLGTGVPATAIVDRDGKVAFRIVGPVSATELRERLNWLTSERKKPEPDTSVDNLIVDECCDHEEEEGTVSDERGADGDAHVDAHDHEHVHDHGDAHDDELDTGEASLVPS